MRRPVGLASALRARSLFRSRQQPSAALRGGALRAAASRPCLSTSCQEFIPLTLAAFGCAPRGRTSCGGQSALPQHFVPGVYSAHASSLRLRSAGAHFVRRPVGLASALRAFERSRRLRDRERDLQDNCGILELDPTGLGPVRPALAERLALANSRERNKINK